MPAALRLRLLGMVFCVTLFPEKGCVFSRVKNGGDAKFQRNIVTSLPPWPLKRYEFFQQNANEPRSERRPGKARISSRSSEFITIKTSRNNETRNRSGHVLGSATCELTLPPAAPPLHPRIILDLAFPFGGCIFIGAGRHDVVVLFNNEIIGKRTIEVNQVAAPALPPGNP